MGAVGQLVDEVLLGRELRADLPGVEATRGRRTGAFERPPAGGRRRRVYEITSDGEAALRDWLTGEDSLTFEMRDEGLLKFFFAGSLSPDEALETVRAKRREHEARLAKLKALDGAASGSASSLRTPNEPGGREGC